MVDLEQTDIIKSKETWKTLWQNLETPHPFLSWEWQNVWWDVFGQKEGMSYVHVVKDEGRVLGIAPLVIENDTLVLSGGREVSDYLDSVALEEDKKKVWEAMLKQMALEGKKNIVLYNVPEQSATITALEKISSSCGYSFRKEQEDVAPYVQLPKKFDEYISSLSRKDRHELRRKMRRFEEATGGEWEIKKTQPETLTKDLDNFFRLFKMRPSEKQKFMTEAMEHFFREECRVMLDLRLLDLSTLCTEETCISMTIGFVSFGRYYLYNSAFDPRFEVASGGLVLKAMLIKESIEKGMTIFDFLQGNEPYKYHLGAKDAKVFKITLIKQANRGQASI